MKSNLFSSFDPTMKGNEQFVDDLHKVMQLDRKTQDSFLKILPKLVQANTNLEREAIATQLNKDIGLDRIKALQTFHVCTFFMGNLDDDDINIKSDATESWAEDLVSYGVLDEKKSLDFIYFASKLRSIYDTEISAISREKSSQIGIIPTITAFGTTVELRGVFNSAYTPNIPVSDYSPKLNSVTPIITVSILVNKSDRNELIFSGTPSDIDALICGLQAATKEAEILQKSCNLV